jgi:saxitoxin biosynthesis operon SxtJ-like protein
LARGIPARLTAAEGRKFAWTVGTAFLVFGGIAWWRDHAVISRVLIGLGAAFWIAGLTVPARLGPVFRFWMGLAHVISRVTTPIFLGIVYFLVMMPIGVLMRLFGRNPVRHTPSNDSFWAPRTEPRGGLTNQF